MADVRDILELEQPSVPEVSKDAILGLRKDVPKKKKEREGMRRPEGMHRELYALLYSDSNKDLPPLLPTDSNKSQGYKSVKAKLGMKRVRPWKWMQFAIPGKDHAVLHHWRRASDEGKEYPFAVFNKKLELLKYTDAEYAEHFVCDGWSRNETDTVFDLCQKYDLRWPVVHDRWPNHLTSRSMVDLKERYYNVTNTLKKLRNLSGAEGKIINYDADHEKRRKQQLLKLYDRTPEQMEEEQHLMSELRKIEARKKEREKKTQDLQKLITAADAESRKSTKVAKKKISQSKLAKTDSVPMNVESCTGIKFPDLKATGVSLRSQRMKLPVNLGQKKVKAIEQLLAELNIENNPMAIEEVCQHFNDLRSDLVLMYDLRTILLNYVFELQTLKHQYESLVPDKVLEIPESLVISTGDESPSKPRAISEIVDAVATPNTPNRKRKAALEQSNVLKKIKART